MRWTVYDYSQHEIVKLNDLNPDCKFHSLRATCTVI